MAAPSPAEPPRGQAIILCDQVITDVNTNNKTLVGTFNRIRTTAFPAIFPRMVVYVALVNSKGPVNIRLLMKKEGSGPPLLEFPGQVEFKNPNEVVEIVFNFIGITFPVAGNYVVEVYADDHYIFDARFTVVQE